MFFMAVLPFGLAGQDNAVGPALIREGVFLGETPALRDLPALTEDEYLFQQNKARARVSNPDLESREYPYAATALPKGHDEAWQRTMGSNRDSHAPIQNINGSDAIGDPSDANGTIGPNHYMQTINLVYTIFNRAGAIVAGPTLLNTLFYGLPGGEFNNGDPIILYDEQADRWLVAEFSIEGANDYMLIAISTSGDPTGTWYKYSFDVADMPDYEKFGVWRDGYYMATSNSSGNDIFVFQRSQMLTGQAAQMVAFDNPNRPSTTNSLSCVPPLDNDGDFAPVGEPGLFIGFNDDAIGGGSDQLWIYELDVDWDTPANSSFGRVQQIGVTAFDSDFGATQANISQQGTVQKLDAIPQVIMNPPQYRNFGTYETIVCCHTVDVDATDHAGIRWYELRRVSSGDWTIRQQGTYAPDSHSRWMGSIMLNGSGEIALGYSVSSSTLYPAIRYCGQSATAYSAGNSTLDVSEEIIQAGTYSHTNNTRWGDYSCMQVDAHDDETFWFTSQYTGASNVVKTKIANFQIGTVILTANFAVSNPNPQIYSTVTLNDASFGSPTGWTWSISPSTYNFVGGTSATSQNPQVQFTAAGSYSISLTIVNGGNNDSEAKTNFVNVIDCGNLYLPFTEDFSDGVLPNCWKNISNHPNGYAWLFNNPQGWTINTTTGANGVAIADSYYYGVDTVNADLITPMLDLSAYTTVNLYFQYFYPYYTPIPTGANGKLFYSINDGATWTQLLSTNNSANPATYNTNVTSYVAGQPRVRFKWNYTGRGYFWAIDDISITGTGPNVWTGTTSGDWATATNWSAGTVPTGTSNVIIPVTAANWPTLTGDFSLGTSCDKITLYGNSQLNITGNLILTSGKTLAFNGNGTINLTGNFINAGGYLVPGNGTINFTGSAPSKIIPATTTTSTITNYQLSTFPKNMTDLVSPTSGPTGDNGNSVISLGFSFNYNGTGYTQARLSTNGWLSLNQSGTTQSANGNLFITTIPNTTLAPWFDNLMDDATSVVGYKTEGTSPYRVFTAEWKSILTFSTGATERISFQVKLFETTNIIEFHYGSISAGTNNVSEGASIGIEDVTGGSSHFIEATTGSSTTGVTNLTATSNWPVVNYRFTPPPGTQTFQNVTVNKTGSYVDILATNTINGDLTISSGSVSGPTSSANNLYLKGDWINYGTYTQGNSTIIFNGATEQSIGGSAAQTFSKLTVNNPAGIALQNNLTVSGTLNMTSGNINCGSYTLELGTSTSVTGTLAWTSGNISGNFKRWIAASTVAPIDFPLGTAITNNNARITFTNNTAGSLTAKFEPGDPGNNSGFPLNENSQTINSNDLYTDGTWTLVPTTLTSTSYALELTGTGFTTVGPPDAEVRILKRPDAGGAWTLNGTHVAGSPPVAKRSGLSGFSRFALAKPCNTPATVTPGGPDAVCASTAPVPLALSGASFGGSATAGAWSITGINPANGGNNGTLSSTDYSSAPASITYTPPSGYAGTVTLTLTTDDPAGSCSPASGTRDIVVSAGNKISGNFTYYNLANTPITSGLTVKLFQGGSQVGSDFNVTSGSYEFTGLCPGSYEVRVSSSNPTDGSINSTDAAQTNYWGAIPYEIEKVRFYAGDVTGSTYYINSTDALRIQGNFVNGTAFDKGSWIFWKAGETINSNSSPSASYPTVTLSGTDLTTNIYGLCAGDFNRSFIPGIPRAASATLELVHPGTMSAGPLEEIELPLHLLKSGPVGAVSLILNFPSELAEVMDVTVTGGLGLSDWAVYRDELRIGWNSPRALYLDSNDVLLTIKLKTTNEFNALNTIKFNLADYPQNELADDHYEVIANALLSIDNLIAVTLGVDEPSVVKAISLYCYPNPFNNMTRISYSLPFDGKVSLEIRNLIGMTTGVLAEAAQIAGNHSVILDTQDLPAGIYVATLTLDSEHGHLTRGIKIIHQP